MTVVKSYEKVRETYVERKKWVLSWKELVKTESLGNEVHIFTTSQVDAIYINGRRLEL